MAKYHDGAVSGSRRIMDVLLTVLLGVLCVVWLYPVLLILINSLKDELAISTATVFELPTSATFAGLHNYVYGITQLNFLQSFGYSAIITVSSVLLILLCCSMCGWYITRVTSAISKAMYLLCVFSMVVPFQMVMFTLSKTADTLKLNTPWTIPVIYLGFGAGLAVFLFTGYMKACPIAIEESATIDGCSPLRTFFSIVLPILQPSLISTGILQAMWIWNDYLLPYLVLDLKRFKTIPIAVQYLRGGYGSVDMGAMMGMLVLAIAPILVMYFLCQKYIVSGVMAGAVKG